MQYWRFLKGAPMRFIVAMVVVALAAPAWAGSGTSACKSRCDSTYKFCMSRAITKTAKKSCKTDRKNCKGQCR